MRQLIALQEGNVLLQFCLQVVGVILKSQTRRTVTVLLVLDTVGYQTFTRICTALLDAPRNHFVYPALWQPAQRSATGSRSLDLVAHERHAFDRILSASIVGFAFHSVLDTKYGSSEVLPGLAQYALPLSHALFQFSKKAYYPSAPRNLLLRLVNPPQQTALHMFFLAFLKSP